jgi:hypothetical protein
MIPLIRPRPRTRARRRRAGRRALRTVARSRPPRRALGLYPLLGRRAPQHDRHRQRRHRRWSSAMLAGGTERDPRRRRRHHAAEPLAAGHRRAVRHARVAVPGPHRPRRWAARPAPTRLTMRALRRDPRSAERFPDDVMPNCRQLFGPVQPGQAVRAVPGAGSKVPLVDPRLEPVRRAGRRVLRAALCVRLALRAGCARRALRRLPALLQAVGAAGNAARDDRRQRVSPTPTTRRAGCSPACSSASPTPAHLIRGWIKSPPLAS